MSPLSAKGLGCFRDTGRRAILPLEGKSPLLKGHYRRRRYAIQKCALAAQKRGYRVFAIQHQGWCASTKYAYRTYGKYGKSRKCRNGKGGPWANDVYVLKGTSHYWTFLVDSSIVCTLGPSLLYRCYWIVTQYSSLGRVLGGDQVFADCTTKFLKRFSKNLKIWLEKYCCGYIEFRVLDMRCDLTWKPSLIIEYVPSVLQNHIEYGTQILTSLVS